MKKWDRHLAIVQGPPRRARFSGTCVAWLGGESHFQPPIGRDSAGSKLMNTERIRCLGLAVTLLAALGCANGPGPGGVGSFPNPPDAQLAGVGSQVPAPRTESFAELMGKGRNYETSGKLDKAREIYESLIVAYSDRAEAYHRLAVVADRQRRYREAQGLYSEALRLEPNNPQLFNDLGYCFFLQGQLGKAESALIKAVAMEPSNERYHNNLGLVYGHQGDYERALEEFRKAGSEADAQYSLAFIFASQDNVEAAKERFHLALLSDPTHEKSREALRGFERYEELPEDAREDLEVVRDGVRYVPYIENAESDGGVQPATATSVDSPDVVQPTQPASIAADASQQRTAELRSRAQQMLRERLSSGSN